MRTSSILLLAVLTVTPCVSRAQEAATQPAERAPRERMREFRGPRDGMEGGRTHSGERGDRHDRPYGMNRPGGGAPAAGGGEVAEGEPPMGDQMPPTEEEWAEIKTFMETHSPNRWAFFMQIKDTRPRGAKFIQDRIIGRYQSLKRIEPNQKLFATMLAKMKAEDEEWGALKKARDEETPEARDALREKVRASVQQNLKDREEKLAKLRAAVAREEETLAADRDRVDQLVNAQMERLLSEYPFGGPSDWGRGPRRPMGGGPRTDRPPQPDPSSAPAPE